MNQSSDVNPSQSSASAALRESVFLSVEWRESDFKSMNQSSGVNQSSAAQRESVLITELQ